MKRIFITILVSGWVFIAEAQDFEFFHSLGGTYIYSISEESVLGAGEITYNPRLNLYKISKSSSLSVSTNLGISFQGSYSSRGTEGGMTLAYELPISLDYNFGHLSASSDRSDFGVFVGAGYALTSIKIESYDDDALIPSSSAGSNTNGFYAHLGSRFSFRTKAMRKAKIPEASLTASLFTILGSNDVNVFGLRVLYNFGQ